MKAYYYENGIGTGVLFECDNQWIAFPEIIDGVEVKMENIPTLLEIWNGIKLDDVDFAEAWYDSEEYGGTLYGYNPEQFLTQCCTLFRMIYERD